ncbi:MAG TPA: hypothetical protein VJU79_02945 [Candidatus Dormibacteraeota bacterium]|nr:hypothetical protein [Candidatus Dormibacteraeota bacterium]
MDEFVIKVPAPFVGIEDLGFSARYPAQERVAPLRDVPVIVEGPPQPMQILVKRLALFAEKDRILGEPAEDEAYTWTLPVQLTDEVCVMAFKDRSQPGGSSVLLADDAVPVSRSYVWNLIRPLAFTFLRDCVRIGGLQLSERIAMVLDTGRPPLVDLELQRASISPVNGRLTLGAH